MNAKPLSPGAAANLISPHRRYSICISSDEVQAIDPGLGGPFHLSMQDAPGNNGIVFLFAEFSPEFFAEENRHYALGLDIRWSLARYFHAEDDYQSPLLIIRANHDYIYTRAEPKSPPNLQAVQTRCMQELMTEPGDPPVGPEQAAVLTRPVELLTLAAADYLMEVTERQYRYNKGALTRELILRVAKERGITAADV